MDGTLRASVDNSDGVIGVQDSAPTSQMLYMAASEVNDQPYAKPGKKKSKVSMTSPSAKGGRKNIHHQKKSSTAFEDFKGALRDELLSIDFSREEHEETNNF